MLCLNMTESILKGLASDFHRWIDCSLRNYNKSLRVNSCFFPNAYRLKSPEKKDSGYELHKAKTILRINEFQRAEMRFFSGDLICYTCLQD